MAIYLQTHDTLLFDYPRFAEPWREELREHAERLAQEHGLAITFIRAGMPFANEDRI